MKWRSPGPLVTDLSRYEFETLRKDGEFVLSRGRQRGTAISILLVSHEVEHGGSPSFRLEHELSLATVLDPVWSAHPLRLARHEGRMALVLADPGGDPMDRLVGRSLELARLLRISISLTTALREVHGTGLIHKDIKPANVLVDGTDSVRITGFGLASRQSRERPSPVSPEVIGGTPAYMAPEQTGRMNRSIDARSDLYSLGVTLYELFTGVLPFTASNPMEWIHCHIARKPMPPSERVSGLPVAVCNIVLKLLAKNAEDRYQTATGVEADLRHCLKQWGSYGRIDPFPLGAHDRSDRLLIPEKLYGREIESNRLLAAFDRVAALGSTELVLVSGYSGIGKSSIVNELHKVLVPPRGLFAAGKFDQYRRGIPYATLAHACQSLIRDLLTKSDAELERWRQALLEALGLNGQVIANLIPEIALIIGDQPPVPELPPQYAQNRFQLVLRRFLGVFARPEHPLVLFLDDLQWLDTATLALVKDITTNPGVGHLMLVGAYRDNEVSDAHPLLQTIKSVRKLGGQVQEIVLTPLKAGDVGRLVADTLHTEPETSQPLAELVHMKTGGNPFFVNQFLAVLEEEGLLTFDQTEMAWNWSVDRIEEKGFTDNVADLMSAKLGRYSASTRRAMTLLACLGSSAETATLAAVYEETEEALHVALHEAASAALVLRSDSRYAFVHDRVQQAAYELLAANARPTVHLNIGRILASRTALTAIEQSIFEIVDQFNRGACLIEAPSERLRVAELNLVAGKRAKDSTAYSHALTYLAAGRDLVRDEDWEQHYRLLFDLELHRGECEYLTGQIAAAEHRFAALAARAANLIDKAAVARQRLALYTILARLDRAVEIGLEFLTHVGIDWSPHPTNGEVVQEYAQIWRQLGERSIEQVAEIPAMTDPGWLATMDVLTAVSSPAIFYDSALGCLMIGRMINLSLQYGHTDGSCTAYVYSNLALGSRFGDYNSGFRFAKTGFDLMQQRKLFRFKPRVYLGFAIANTWIKHVSESIALVRSTLDMSREGGDLVFEGYALRTLLTCLIASGTPLAEVRIEAENALEFARKAKFDLIFDIVSGHLALIRTLQGHTYAFGSFDDDAFDEARFEQHLEDDPRLAFAACWYWIRKLQARYYAGDYISAIGAEEQAGALLSAQPSFRFHFDAAEYHFYGALARAAHCRSLSPESRNQHLAALQDHRTQLQAWSEHGPANFANRAALVRAEIASLDGRVLEAEHLYEDAIRSAREHGFTQNEGIANELAGRFYAERGLETIANAYLMNARTCYQMWGAFGKVSQLEQLHPHLRLKTVVRSAGPTGTPLQDLDLATVVRVSQAVSSEIDLVKLIETIMTVGVEHAGAERGLLILMREGQYHIEATASTGRDAVTVNVARTTVTSAELPQSILRYVIRSQDTVILEDALAPNQFSADVYLREKNARSVLCLPLLKQASLMGVLYLENNQATRVFTPARIGVLRLLVTQAAISLEHARLYTDSQRRQDEMNGLVSALHRSEAYRAEAQKLSHTGSFGWDALSGELIWSEETFRIFGYEPATNVTIEMLLKRVHPDDHARVARVIESAARDGESFDLEHRLLMPDGSVKHLHVVARALPDLPENLQFAGAVMDITARKASEHALRNSEKRYQDIFQAMAVSFWELDYTRSGQMLRALREDGVVDFRRYFRENPDFVRDLMHASRVVDVNDHTVELFGQGSREALRSSVVPFWPDESLPDYIEAVLASIERNEGISIETRLCKRDGSLFDAHFTLRYASEDKARGLAGIIDITARKQAFAKMEASEQRYRHLFHHMPVALWQLNASGVVELFKKWRSEGIMDLGAHFDAHPDLVQRCMELMIIEEVNEHTVQMLGGRDAREFVGTSIAPYFPRNSPTFRRSMISRYRGEPQFGNETKLSTLDGRVLDVLYTASRVGSTREPGMSLLGVIDITERKKAEEALRRSEQRYRHLFRNTPVALWQLNAQPLAAVFKQLRASGVEDLSSYMDDHPEFLSGVLNALIVEEVNDHAVKLFGARDRSELVGRATQGIWRESMDTLRRVLESRWRGEDTFQETTKIVTRDHRVIDVLFTTARPPMIEGLPISLVSMVDLTDQVSAQAELQRVRADFAHAARVSMLGELTASIAHEVNQPLAAIAASGEAGLRWLAKSIPDVDEVRDLTARMVADARRASKIVARIRDMATARAPERVPLSLDDVIREALSFLRHELQSRGVVASHFPATAAGNVFADRTQLQQVIVNLVVNAMQAIAQEASARGSISIRTVADDFATVRCSVEDSGPGIAPEYFARLFDSFFTTKDGGMGMGLRICRSVIEAHGGRVAADNGSAHGGARLSFTLPVHTTSA